MRLSLLCLITLMSAGQLNGQALDDATRKALLEKLTAIEETSERQVDERFRIAMLAYKEAVSSNEKAIDLYLKCVEKVRFKDQLKDGKEFRDWKEKNHDQQNTPSFKLALRHQLNWLVLTLRAASKDADQKALAQEALKGLDTIYGSIEDISDQYATLKQPVLSSVFAEAYNLQRLESRWPGSPVDLKGIYEGVIMPPLRAAGNTQSLEAAWDQRIRYEGIDAVAWNSGKHGGSKDREAREQARDEQTLKEDKFRTETRPQLLWEKYTDLYAVGDQIKAATGMLQHITANPGHPSSAKWIKQLREKLSPKQDGGSPAAPP